MNFKRKIFLITAIFAAFFSLAVTSGIAQSVDDRAIFCSEFVPFMESSSVYTRWQRQNPGEASKWVIYRTAICNGENPSDPLLATAFGKALIAAGKMAIEASPPSDTTPPAVSITSPADGASVSGTISVNANASDNIGVSGVQFKLDGNNLGAEDNSAPYSIALDTTAVSDGAHALAAEAKDAAGNAASSSIQINVNNAPPPGELINIGETSILATNDSGNGNLLVSQKVNLGQRAILQSLSFYVTSAAGNLRLGVYDASGPGGGPGIKLAETVSFAPVSGWNTTNVLAQVQLEPGNYWLAYLPSSSSLGFRVGSGDARWYGFSYGAMPNNYSTSPSSGPFAWSFYATLLTTDEPPPPPPPAQCADSLDNDGDGKIDLADPGCVDATDNDETDPPPPGQITLTAIDGGLGYYGLFSNPLPISPSYFPIGVWGSYAHEQVNRDKDAAVGLNLYVWVADNSYMDEIRADGRFQVIQDEGNRTGVGSETAGWLLGDEIDMTQGPGACPGVLQQIKNGLPADGRLTYANYGKGVLIWETDQEAQCFMQQQDVTSTDLYWFTDPFDGVGNRFGSKYGDNITRQRFLDRFDGIVTPQWAFIEVGWPFTESASQGGRAILPDEIRSAVWHSIIAGARGIIYFQHNFGGPCITHFVLRGECYPENAAMATQVDAQIKSLAPVLNSPYVTSGHSASDTIAGTVRYMVKWDGSNFYIFAGADQGSGSASFSIPCVGNANATVIGEGRNLTVSNGSFNDSFADKNAIHIYRIDGGSRCGL